MGFWSSVFNVLKNVGPIIALDSLAAALNGSKPQKANQLLNKSFSSDAYGTNWYRCRGTTRCQGKMIWATGIQTSIWKTSSGGIFGIGQQSLYYNKYSMSMYIGFGKKLGGGAAKGILRIWADGKPLFTSPVSDAVISGTVTTTVVGGGQTQGSQVMLVDLASGATLTLNPGDQITIPSDPLPYTVQTAVNLTGPTSSSQIPIWPPLRSTLAGGGAVSIPGITTGVFDLSSFDPNPHDGSHTAGGYDCPTGGIRFYLGSDTQAADPLLIQKLGTGNVPGFTGLCGVLIHDLQLVNYGDHPPAITAEVAWDPPQAKYPLVGPIAGLPTLMTGGGMVGLPFSAASSINFLNPLNPLPYAFVIDGGNSPDTIYRVNTQTNQVEATMTVPETNDVQMVVDTDGYFYVTGAGAPIYKYDGLAMQLAGQTPQPLSDPCGMTSWDTEQSLFGNPIIIKSFAAMETFGGMYVYQRYGMTGYGVANPASIHSYCLGFEQDSAGNPIPVYGAADGITLPTPYASFIAGASLAVDVRGDIWILQKDKVRKYNGQFNSGVMLDSQTNFPKPFLYPPSFAYTDYSVSGVTTHGGFMFYDPSDDTMILVGDHLGKVDAKTGAVLLTATNFSGGATPPSAYVDLLGTLIIGGPGNFARYDTSTLQLLSTYHVSSYGSIGTAFRSTYDQLTDSVWQVVNLSGTRSVYRLYLDRSNGLGIGLDDIVTSIMTDAGYDPSQFDVTKLTSSGITCFGVEFDREAFVDSLKKLMQLYLFDAAPIDGKMVFIPRGQSSAITILEDDLGALDDPTKYEPRIIETIQDADDIPEYVSIHYYDHLKDDQPAVQYEKRISKPYASSLSSGKDVTSSRQQSDLNTPVTENATPMKQQAALILWDAWAGRRICKFKLGPKYSRLTPGDVITVTYKGVDHLLRIEEVDFGASGALEITARSQDNSVYDTTYLPVANPGSGSGVPIVNPPAINLSSYTIVPASPLSQFSATQIDMTDVVATFSTGQRAFYNSRSFTVADPGAGNSQLYYVTVYDPNGTGEQSGTTSLTDYCDVSPNSVFLGNAGYIFMGTITITHDLVGVIVTSGGSPNISQAQGFYVNGSGGTPFGTKVDLITYLVNSQRATKHLTGTGANTLITNIYSQLDTPTHSIAHIKSAAGWANDIHLYDANWIYNFATELDDVGYRLWSDPSSYKKFQTPFKMMPRYVTLSVPIPDIVNSGSNPFNRYVSCGFLDTINRGSIICRNYFTTMNFDSQGTGGGNLGTISVLVQERYAGQTRERFYWGLNLGFVKWDVGTLISGSLLTGQFKITNWSVHNKLVAGGGVTSSFACGYGVGWP